MGEHETEFAQGVERVAETLRASRLCWGTHADRWSDQEWQRGFWTEVAETALAALSSLRAERGEG